jgi:arginase
MMQKEIKIIKNRSDIGAGTRGSDMGVDAIEIAAINNNSDFFNLYEFEDVKTHNESIYDKYHSSVAKRIEFVVEQCTRVSNSVQKNLNNNYFPIVLSGDHSSALGTISGIKAAYPDQNLGVIWIDAHADLHSPFTTPSGNIHGMPLAAALGNDNLDCQVNELSKDTENHWVNLKNIGIEGSKIKADNLVYFGVRDTEKAEDELIAKLHIRNYKVEEVRYRGLELCVNEAIAKLADCDMIYVSFDVDSMDCDLISFGTGTPVSRGFDQYEIIEIVNQILKTKKVVCLEVVEVNPLLDTKGNTMAETAFQVLESIATNLVLEPNKKLVC